MRSGGLTKRSDRRAIVTQQRGHGNIAPSRAKPGLTLDCAAMAILRFLGQGLSAVLLMVALASGAPAWADYAGAVAALNRGDYSKALREFQDAARAGDARAEHMLGYMAEQGLGRTADLAEALRRYRAAAQAGLPASMVVLGFKHDIGEDLPRDGAAAHGYYAEAARRGSVVAKNNLAYLWARQKIFLEEALCLSAETLAVEPDSATYLDTYGFVLLRMGRLDEAARFFAKAHALEPEDGIAIEHQGDIAQARGDDGLARALWRQARPLSRFFTDQKRIDRKLAGAADFDEHAPFEAKNDGFGRQCAVPTV